eukprot:CAMPEP_0172863138 /NCGR_PEP_ID=MMETSP1075-20121228/76307_1 /TAXON_ID=2916 /ORGANISM="Ceratium fusus, Strain PA161109" /LENGTH=97 /DNA_ID=CAMNT_0013711645 /DNA_START=43 /DNA_END=333 /DNA_ORIENTATION=-
MDNLARSLLESNIADYTGSSPKTKAKTKLFRKGYPKLAEVRLSFNEPPPYTYMSELMSDANKNPAALWNEAKNCLASRELKEQVTGRWHAILAWYDS